MNNEDLKRFYKQYHIEGKDFVRFDENGKIPKELIDGAGLTVVELTSLSGTLTDEQYATLSGESAVIKLSTQYFYKAFDASTIIIYQAFSRQAGQDQALLEIIEITKSTKAWELKAENIVEANPTLAGTETDLTSLKVGNSSYKINTYKAFPNTWTTTGTINQFCASVDGDSNAVAGNAYLGELRCSDLPATLVNVEAVVEIIDGSGTSGKVIHINVTSGNVAPHRWEYTYWNSGADTSGWITFGGGHLYQHTIAIDGMVYRASSLQGVTVNLQARAIILSTSNIALIWSDIVTLLDNNEKVMIINGWVDDKSITPYYLHKVSNNYAVYSNSEVSGVQYGEYYINSALTTPLTINDTISQIM